MTKESSKHLLLSALYIFLSLTLLVLIFKFGITAAVEISLFLQKRNFSETSSGSVENIVQIPDLFPITEATNSAYLPISGYALPNQKIDIFINDLEVKSTETNSEGKFESEISLSLGLSKIYAISINSQGVKSSPSKSWTVFYNNSPPYLEILEPENNITIKGKQNAKIVIKGKISPPSKVYINDHLMILENERYFNYPATLQPGENEFKIVCLDPAQNKSEREWIITYSP